MLYDYGEDTKIEISDRKIHIEHQLQEKIDALKTDEFPISIGDLGDIIRKHKIWQSCFPRVEPFYAVKCNDLYPVIRLLADMGLSFDCASKTEIQKILNLGVDPSRIIYANTCKHLSFIKFAAQNNVSLMTFDCEDELMKIKQTYPSARLVLRISPQSNYKVKYYLGRKFGCHPKEAYRLFEVAKKLNLNIVGISFHVGCGCLEAGAFEAAIEQSRMVFDIGLDMGFQMNILDIGGGFPGQKILNVKTDITFEKIAKIVNQSLDKHFPGNSVRIIAEPGQFFVASAFTVATNIIARKLCEEDDIKEVVNGDGIEHNDRGENKIRMYYVNAGIYTCFLTVMSDPGCYIPSFFKIDREDKLYNSVIWGPTCDALDMIIENIKLPELKTGEWIYFKDTGAYTFITTTHFNAMPTVKHFFVCELEKWKEIYQCFSL